MRKEVAHTNQKLVGRTLPQGKYGMNYMSLIMYKAHVEGRFCLLQA